MICPLPLIGSALHAPDEGLPITGGLKYKTDCITEVPFTIVRGCRTLVALDETGFVIARGILEPGGNRQKLVDDLDTLLQMSSSRSPGLRLVVD